MAMRYPVVNGEMPLAEQLYEAYRQKLTDVNAGKTMTGAPMPSWDELLARKPDEPGGHVASCWQAVADAAAVFYQAKGKVVLQVSFDASSFDASSFEDLVRREIERAIKIGASECRS